MWLKPKDSLEELGHGGGWNEILQKSSRAAAPILHFPRHVLCLRLRGDRPEPGGRLDFSVRGGRVRPSAERLGGKSAPSPINSRALRAGAVPSHPPSESQGPRWCGRKVYAKGTSADREVAVGLGPDNQLSSLGFTHKQTQVEKCHECSGLSLFPLTP